MDRAERDRFLATLRADESFRGDVRRELLTEELLNLPQAVSTLVEVAAQQRQDFTALAGSVRNYMEQTISAIRTGLSAVGDEISAVGDDISSLRTNMEELRTNMEAGFVSVDATFDQVHADLRDIKDQLAS
ncbi:MAG: hypothetical protein ACRDYD_11870 [Acidimicrobiales bacterium]